MAQKAGGAGAKKHGRNKDKCASYRANKTREKNKLRRILKASGAEEARRYAARFGLSAYLERSL